MSTIINMSALDEIVNIYAKKYILLCCICWPNNLKVTRGLTTYTNPE